MNITLGYDTRFDVDRHPILSAQTAATDAEPASARDWAPFGSVQATVAKSGSRRSNDRIGVGGRYRFSERFAATAEVSEGDLGAGARVGGEFNYSDRGALYLAHTLEAENPDALNSGRLGRSTLGMRNRFNDWVSVFAEARHDTGAGATGTVQHFGVDFTPFEKWLYAVSYETGTLQDPAGGEIDRDAASATIGYSHDQNRVSATLEVRSDDNPQTGDLDIRAGRALAAYQLNPATRLHAKLHASRTESSIDSTLDAKFTEAVLAAAYRPLANDDLNLLFKYTYLADLPSPAQVSALGVPIDFAQRSHVFAVDGTAQLTERFALGAKYAYRRGELRASRDDTADWFSSSSDFLAVRADWYFVEQWDVLIEARRLRVREADDERTGVLAAVHRHFGNHLKIGVGYNFTDFSDDLTDLSFDAHGIFINVLGMY